MARTLLGIDLGTTFSLAAVLQDGRPIVLPNSVGELLTPSAVAVDEVGSVLVGAAARARATTHPHAVALEFKRDMGTQRRYSLGARSFTATELSALVLGAVKRDAEAALGESVEEAVVTVPAYFGDLQRQATRDAAAIAGLKVNRIINEPTAAALAYGLNAREREFKAAVLDLGGGTFDVTVLEIMEGVIEIQSSAGDVRLGGVDFDEALAVQLLKQLGPSQREAVRADSRAWARVKDAVERAKKTLSSQREALVALPGLSVAGALLDVEAKISRDEAEAVWAPLLQRMRAPILRALNDARLGPSAIDEVLLVGGATRMPCVAQLAATLFGRLPLKSLPPDEAVAQGAAVQAALVAGDSAVEDLVVTDVAPFTLGIATADRMGANVITGVFSPVLERGTVIPASRVRRFSTMHDRQTEILVDVFQGEHARCAENTHLGTLKVRDIPRNPAGMEAIDVRFTYDLNGILEVEVTIVSTGKVIGEVFEQRPGALSRAELERARAAMAALKLHPKDALPNTTALNRAEALYLELTGSLREELGQVMSAFRLALERQEPEEIERLRNLLVSAVRAYAQ